MEKEKKTTALYTGSFDPFTKGHAYVVGEALELFDKVIIMVGVNSAKTGMFSMENRVSFIRELYKDIPGERLEVIAHEGMTADYIMSHPVDCIVKGVRNTKDCEYELQQNDVNQFLLLGHYKHVPTVMIPCPSALAHISSSLCRDLIYMYGFENRECSRELSSLMPAGTTIRLKVQGVYNGWKAKTTFYFDYAGISYNPKEQFSIEKENLPIPV